MPVYFIQTGENIKIGFSKNPELRIGTLDTANPLDLKILLVIDGGRDDEAFLHHRFRKDRIKGEWFKSTSELICFIDRLKHLAIPVFVDGAKQVTLEEIKSKTELKKLNSDILEKYNKEMKILVAEKNAILKYNEEMASLVTDKQLLAIKTALTIGYFDTPRKAGAKELGDLLSIAPSTAVEHLRKAEKYILTKYLEINS